MTLLEKLRSLGAEGYTDQEIDALAEELQVSSVTGLLDDAAAGRLIVSLLERRPDGDGRESGS